MNTHNDHNHLIAVVDDDPSTRHILNAYFSDAGYQVYEAADATSFLKLHEQHPIDLILLDIRLPDIDGLELTRRLRAESNIGIILVTGLTDSVDRIVGLEIGADDYVTKPFDKRELLARARNVIRRIAGARHIRNTANILRFGRWTLNMDRRQLTDEQQQPINLTSAEYELLCHFASHPNQTYTREQLMQAIPHRKNTPSDRTIDNLILRLRQKLGDHDGPIFATVHGVGYTFSQKVD